MRLLRKYDLDMHSKNLNFKNYYNKPLGIKLINNFIYDSVITIFQEIFGEYSNVQLKEVTFNFIDSAFKTECIFLSFDYIENSPKDYLNKLQPLINKLDIKIQDFISKNLHSYINSSYLNIYHPINKIKSIPSFKEVYINKISSLDKLYNIIEPYSNKVIFKTIERKTNTINSITFYYKVIKSLDNTYRIDIYFYNYSSNITTPTLYREYIISDSIKFFNKNKDFILENLQYNTLDYSTTDNYNNICLLNSKSKFEIIKYIKYN